MKYLSILFVVIAISFSSCRQTNITELSLAQRLAEDETFEMMLSSTGDLLKHSISNNWTGKSQELVTLIDKFNKNSGLSSDYVRAEELLGMPYETYRLKLKNYGELSQAFLESYPSLEKMNSEKRRVLFQEVYSINPDLPLKIADSFGDSFRGCVFQDLCKGVVTIGVLVGGPALCVVISAAIPVIGSLLCSIVIARNLCSNALLT